MWILFILNLTTGSVTNLEFSNIESCEHARSVLVFKDSETICLYSKSKNVMEPHEPGQPGSPI